jgi:hypothetical protein
MEKVCWYFKMAKILLELLEEHTELSPHTGFQRGGEKPLQVTTTAPEWRQPLLHYQGDMASVVRWIGGTSCGCTQRRRRYLAFAERLSSQRSSNAYGEPGPSSLQCRSNANFQEYRRYGNATMHEEPDTTRLLKRKAQGVTAYSSTSEWCISH